MCSLPTPSNDTFAQEGSRAVAREAGARTSVVLARRSELQIAPDLLPLMAVLTLFRCCPGSELALSPPPNGVPSSVIATLFLVWSGTRAGGARVGTHVGQGFQWGTLGTPVRVPDCSQSVTSANASNGPPLPVWILSQLHSPNCALYSPLSAFYLVWQYPTARGSRLGDPSVSRHVLGKVVGNQPESLAVSIRLLHLVPQSKQAYVCSLSVESRFLTALLLVPLVSNHLRDSSPQCQTPGLRFPICG